MEMNENIYEQSPQSLVWGFDLVDIDLLWQNDIYSTTIIALAELDIDYTDALLDMFVLMTMRALF